MNIEDIAKEWKIFNQRQDRIFKRNLHSDEYHTAVNKTYDFMLHDLWSAYLEEALDKDMYKKSIEGLLDWINDGRPE